MGDRSLLKGLLSRNARSSVIGAVSWFVTAAMSFLLTPVIVNGLGTVSYGIYALVIGFVAYSFNLNLSRAMTSRIAACRANGETDSIKQLVGVGILVHLFIGVLGFTTIWFGSGFYADLVVPEADREDVRNALRLAGATIVFLLLIQSFSSVIQSYGRFGLFTWITVLYSGGTLVVNAVLVVMGYGVVTILMGTVAVMVLLALGTGAVALRLLGGLPTFGLKGDVVRELISNSKFVVGYQILANALLIFERSSISGELGSEALAFYVVPTTVCVQFLGLVYGMSIFLLPAFAEQRLEPAQRRALYSVATRLSVLLVVLVALGTSVHGGRFLGLWIDPSFSREAGPVFTIQILSFGAIAVSMTAYHLADAMGRSALNFVATLVAVVVSAGVMLGAETVQGYAIGRLVGFSAYLLLIPISEHLFMGGLLLKEWFYILSRILIASVLFAASQAVLANHVDGGWGGLAISVGAGTGAFTGALYLMGYFDDIVLYLKNERS